jgi:hypothetical protein
MEPGFRLPGEDLESRRIADAAHYVSVYAEFLRKSPPAELRELFERRLQYWKRRLEELKSGQESGRGSETRDGIGGDAVVIKRGASTRR